MAHVKWPNFLKTQISSNVKIALPETSAMHNQLEKSYRKENCKENNFQMESLKIKEEKNLLYRTNFSIKHCSWIQRELHKHNFIPPTKNSCELRKTSVGIWILLLWAEICFFFLSLLAQLFILYYYTGPGTNPLVGFNIPKVKYCPHVHLNPLSWGVFFFSFLEFSVFALFVFSI